MRRLAAFLTVLFVLSPPSWPQTGQGGTTLGVLPFETWHLSNVESINLSDLGIFLRFPVRDKLGAIPFDFSVHGQGQVYPTIYWAPYPYSAPYTTWQADGPRLDGTLNAPIRPTITYKTQPNSCPG